eukprot:3303674-Pleurochrysis_carterae.AAC.1
MANKARALSSAALLFRQKTHAFPFPTLLICQLLVAFLPPYRFSPETTPLPLPCSPFFVQKCRAFTSS